MTLLSSPGWRAACLYLVGWFSVTGFVWMLKGFVGRPRPAAALSSVARGGDGAQEPGQTPPPAPPSWLRRCYAARRARWPLSVDKHAEMPNAVHSFPSMDAACAGVFAAVVDATHAAAGFDSAGAAAGMPSGMAAALASLVGAVCVGRVVFFAHHLADTLVGASIGFGVTRALAYAAPAAAAWPWLLLWCTVWPLTIRAFFAAARVQVALMICIMVALAQFAPLSSSLAAPPLVFSLCIALAMAFRAQSLTVKDCVIHCLDAAWEGSAEGEAERALPPHLAQTLARKRAEFRTQSSGRTTFPGNVHLIGRLFRCPFFGEWDALQRLLGERLRDWSLQTGVPLGSFDVVLGVMTGGGFLAPLAADLCAESEIGSRRRPTVEYIKVSRYEEDVYTVGAMVSVLIDQLMGKHERQYKVSSPPLRAALEGKRVLIVDDASASGGTLKTAWSWAMEAGAAEAHGVALKVISGYWSPHAGDGVAINGKRLLRKPAVPLDLPTFTPWGTF